ARVPRPRRSGQGSREARAGGAGATGRPAHVQALALAAPVLETAHGHDPDGLARHTGEQQLTLPRGVEHAEIRVLAPRRRLHLGEVAAEDRLRPGALLAEQ